MSDVPLQPAAEEAAVLEAPEVVPEARVKRRPMAPLLATGQSLAVTVVIALFVITFLVQAFQIPTESMEDTLLIGDYLLVDKVPYGTSGFWGKLEPHQLIRRGDIIVFRYPVNPKQHFVKRVIGLPGDRIRIINKQVWVNGEALLEGYVVHKERGRNPFRDDFPNPAYMDGSVDAWWWARIPQAMDGNHLVVPRDSYFVLGDNRDQSADSRYWGFVPRENVIGRPLLIYFSVERSDPALHTIGGGDDRLVDFTDTLRRLPRMIRWDRTLRLIH